MSTRKQVKANQNLSKRIWKLSSPVLKRLMKWLLRSLLIMGRRDRLSRSGFVLPTVIMVSLVIVLLTTAILLRSFERSKNASNVRVNQVVLNAAAPAIDRARAKIDALFNDSTLSRTTPSDIDLYNAIKTNPQYTFGDETRLKLAQEFNNKLGIQGNTPALVDDETLTTAWKFPVDTDNNGKYDSFTFYGIYFRSPSRATTGSDVGKFNRARNPLEARTPPMAQGGLDQQCYNAIATSASPMGDSSWYKSGSKLKKSFFVFVATVPNTNRSDDKYEPFKGNQGFSALEFQQDRSLIPLNNNAAWFEDDLELTPNTPFRFNGKVQTNGNLLVGGHQQSFVQFYQVSSKNSCFYQQENAKITVGGNVGTGDVADTTDQAAANVTDRTDPGAVIVDLYSDYPDRRNPSFGYIGGINKSTNSNGGSQIAYNDAAYNQRIALMEQTALSSYYCREYGQPCSETNPPRKSTVLAITQYPEDVKNRFANRVDANSSLNAYNVLAEEIEIYLKNRTRRVPYAEISAPDGKGALDPYDNAGTNIDTSVFGDPSSPIEPPDRQEAHWRQPLDENNQLTNTNPYIKLDTSQLQATWPKKQRQDGKESLLGDRVLVGNNLPAVWKKDNDYVTGNNSQLLGRGINWTQPNDKPRYRTTQVQKLFDLGMSDRDGFWEENAANNPKDPANDPLANFGGLRAITGDGIYYNSSSSYEALSTSSFMPAPTGLDSGVAIPNTPLLAGESIATPYTLVWSDTMPMKGGVDDPATSNIDESTAPPDLRMRATAVYHYKQSSGTTQTPIACVSSYYDPTNATTAQNGQYRTTNGLPGGSGGSNLPPNPDPAITATAGSGRSNNGVVYPAPYTSDAGRFSAIATYATELKAQAKMMFPSGRIVNEPLQKALQKLSSGEALADSTKPLSLSENSAIDTAICAIKILDGTLVPSSNPVFPHGAIKEASFLDARQVKALDKTLAPNTNDPISQSELSSSTYNVNNNYNLALEQRQPLEVRVTEINLSTDDTQGITRKTIVMNEVTDNTMGNPSKTIGQDEYFLPNSGIIYASRDDALPDASDATNAAKLLSPTDFRLDPTRRPNGIRLINGSNLSRLSENTYREEEKGLILVTNLPVYVKGDFNLHRPPGGSTDIEEFRETLVPNWDNFYTRVATAEPNFACRPGRTGCPSISSNLSSNGDTWRTATIISDAVTLLSGNFQDGFRDQGDFDLRNNAGSSVTQNRKKNGFWDNSFVTSALWWDTNNTNNAYPAEKTTNSYVSSYLTNGVTPVQRRVNFPEYVMEICRKLPVSACTPSDWIAGSSGSSTGAGSTTSPTPSATTSPTPSATTSPTPQGASSLIGTPAANLVAGTTAKPAIDPADQRYPRRVAFQRDSSGKLSLLQGSNGAVAPTPLGIDSSGKVAAFPYPGTNTPNTGTSIPNTGSNTPNTGTSIPNTGTSIPNLANNALWFRTTTNTSGKPFCNGNNDPVSGCTSDDRSYANDKPLYYDGNTRLFSPSTPDIPGVPSLNLPDENPASSYTICTEQSSSKNYLITNTNKPELGQCSTETGNPMAQIQEALQGFLSLQPDDAINTTNIVRRPQQTGIAGAFDPSVGSITFASNPLAPSQPIVNVIDIIGDFTYTDNNNSGNTRSRSNPTDNTRTRTNNTGNNNASSCPTRLELVGNDNSIFVLRKNSDLNFGIGSGTGCAVQLILTGVDPNNVFWAINGNVQWNVPGNSLAGTLITKSASTPNWQNVNFSGGGRVLGFNGVPSNLPPGITAIASKAQPSLEPVLQIHSPDGSPGSGSNLDQGNGQLQNQWIQQAKTDTTFNAAFVSGNSPSRSVEEPAGLENFVRFLEQWQGRTTKINGDFIQLKRSAYATAPFAPIISDNITKNDGSLSIFGYTPTKYPVGGTPAGTVPYYTAPSRQWGFDVGLLSQSPDLFAQKFTQQSIEPPNEFFREVGRNDPWIQTLLCAAEASDRLGGLGADYTQYAILDKNQRPSACKSDSANYPANQ